MSAPAWERLKTAVGSALGELRGAGRPMTAGMLARAFEGYIAERAGGCDNCHWLTLRDEERLIEIQDKARRIDALEAVARPVYRSAAKPDGNAGMAAVPLPLLEALGVALGEREGI